MNLEDEISVEPLKHGLVFGILRAQKLSTKSVENLQKKGYSFTLGTFGCIKRKWNFRHFTELSHYNLQKCMLTHIILAITKFYLYNP